MAKPEWLTPELQARAAQRAAESARRQGKPEKVTGDGLLPAIRLLTASDPTSAVATSPSSVPAAGVEGGVATGAAEVEVFGEVRPGPAAPTTPARRKAAAGSTATALPNARRRA